MKQVQSAPAPALRGMWGDIMKRRGFTLIELLVVIAIIAILAAILFPVFIQAKERGRQATCCSNLKQISQAMFNYCDDHNGLLPVSQRRQMINAGWPAAGVVEWTGSRWSAYSTAPAPCNVKEGSLYRGGYLRNVGVFNCPSDRDSPSWYGKHGNKLPRHRQLAPVTFLRASRMGFRRGLDLRTR